MSSFKPEFSGKPEEDAEAHILCSNDWMNAHHFNDDVKVQRFCLTLFGEARLWFHSLESLEDTTWPQSQNLFRQRYSKLGNTHEQLFHAWRSFTFNENTETIDSYVIWIRQVATLLGYGEPQILEVFKNTLPTKLYWILFPIEDLRQAVDTSKRILTKEELDKQLTGQTSISPFMNVRDATERKVSFNIRDEFGDKIDKLTVVLSRLAAKDSHEKGPSNPKYIRVEVRIGLIIREVIRRGQIVGTGDNLQVVDPDRTIETAILEETLEGMVDKIIEEDIEMIDIMITIEVGIDQEKGHLQEIIVVAEIEV